MGESLAWCATLRIVRPVSPSRSSTILAAAKILSLLMYTLYAKLRTLYTGSRPAISRAANEPCTELGDFYALEAGRALAAVRAGSDRFRVRPLVSGHRRVFP